MTGSLGFWMGLTGQGTMEVLDDMAYDSTTPTWVSTLFIPFRVVPLSDLDSVFSKDRIISLPLVTRSQCLVVSSMNAHLRSQYIQVLSHHANLSQITENLAVFLEESMPLASRMSVQFFPLHRRMQDIFDSREFFKSSSRRIPIPLEKYIYIAITLCVRTKVVILNKICKLGTIVCIYVNYLHFYLPHAPGGLGAHLTA